MKASGSGVGVGVARGNGVGVGVGVGLKGTGQPQSIIVATPATSVRPSKTATCPPQLPPALKQLRADWRRRRRPNGDTALLIGMLPAALTDTPIRRHSDTSVCVRGWSAAM